MKQGFKVIISGLCILLISGIAAANCGNCPGDKKACPAKCQKACCTKTEAKTCQSDCKKACCAKDNKATCNKSKKVCGKSCKKACSSIVGKTAPDFTLKDLAGKDVQLSQLKGNIVVLEWTNYDCPFVKAHYAGETKTTEKLAKKYADKGVVWLTINSTHYATAETNAEWAEKHGLKQTILVDSDGKVGKLYKAKTTPHLFVIDKEGKVAYQGAIDNAPMGKTPEGQELVNYVNKAISELLDGKKVETPVTKPYGCSVKYAKK